MNRVLIVPDIMLLNEVKCEVQSAPELVLEGVQELCLAVPCMHAVEQGVALVPPSLG